MKNIIAIFLIGAGLTACDQKSTDGTKDRARAEEQAGTDVANENLANKSKAMEADLRKRYRFFKGVDSQYEGNFKINENIYRLKMTLVPTIKLVETDRIRTLEEIQDDINNLALTVQTSVWYVKDNVGIGGCVFEKVKPDLVTGIIQLASAECPNRFVVTLSNVDSNAQNRTSDAGIIAKDLYDGNRVSAEYLHVDASSKYNPDGWNALIEKKK